MGICPMNAEQQLINEKNRELTEMMAAQLKQLNNYGFSHQLFNELRNIRSRYLYTTAILEDLERIELYSRVTVHKESNENMDLNLEEQLTNSCLILQNEADLLESKDGESNDDANDSFQTNMRQNQSIVAQINIIYSKDIKREQYLQSLRVFLKWGQIFQQHSYAGFINPLYQHFCHFICTLSPQDFSSIVDEVCVFVQFMVTIVTEVYGLKRLAGSDCGKLIKNENVYNMIMSMIFKRTKLKKFLISVIKVNDKNKIQLFQRQIARFKNKPPQFFEISKKFILRDINGNEEVNKSLKESTCIMPYSQSLKLVSELSKAGAPITKLKTIVNISKEIIQDIERYYRSIDKQAPQLDPDNLSAIVMYLLIRNGNKSIYEELKIVEHFTTTNCLNCISGYYLNVFNASIESILTLQEQ